MKTRTLTILVVIMSVTIAAQQGPYKYPSAKKADQIDDFFGTKIADPYRCSRTPTRRTPGRGSTRRTR